MDKRVLMFYLLILLSAARFVSAGQCGIERETFRVIEDSLRTIGEAGALLMMSIEGAKYITSGNPQERESARRGIIYIVIGLIILQTAVSLTEYFLCSD